MNLPEYRAAVHTAHVRFRSEVEEAGERLQKALLVAEQEFFEETPKEVAAEDRYPFRDEHSTNCRCEERR